LRSLLQYRPVGRRFDFPRFLVRSTASLRLAPNEASYSFSLRFHSRVFSTPQRFPSTPKFRGSISHRNRSWDPLFRAFPLQGSRAPLEAALLPCRYPPTCRTVLPVCLITTRFTDSRAFDAVAMIPEQLWTPFSRAEARFPVALDSAQRNRFIPPASPTSKLLSPHKSVRDQSELPRPDGRYSLEFCLPLWSVLRPRLAFSTRPGLADLNPSLRP
jgi:hypothetical protein